ncbi:hypothetical protein EXIGLDRAFT_724907 [Exidia glandulosa HHB12029]|uniref:Uncharacterized protein n=1 Tax=Exidia glandulosa HHB12029 TaxID=1314781 RepID=A0A165E8B0_EXIGL|nr:hypothetical protein EXIGLDRAFT_724907 [Exidia glandulosa HHB12029]
MEAYVRTNRSSVIVNLCVSGVLLPASVVLAYFTFRRSKKLHLTASWYLVSFATACLVGFHASVLAWAISSIPLITSGGPWADGIFYAERIIQPVLTAFFALYGLTTLAACRTAFWEITAHRVFERHNMGRWILLAFDILPVLVASTFFIVDVMSSVNSYRFYYSDWFRNGGLNKPLLDHLFDTGARIVQYATAAGYVNAAFGMYFARRWTNEFQYGASLADAMFRVVAPTLLFQVLLVVPTAALRIKIVFYTSIFVRVQQLLVTSLLAWTLWKYPLKESADDEPVLPALSMLWTAEKRAVAAPCT